MPSVGFDPETGRLTLDGEVLEREDPRMWGTAGHLFESNSDPNTDTYRNWAAEQLRNRPQYYDVNWEETEGGQRLMRLALKPEVAERLGGRMQLPQSGVGGYSEARDPAGITWDDEFGLVTDPNNIGEPDNGPALLQPRTLAAITAALIGGGIAGSNLGLFGAEGGLGLGAAEAGAEGFLGLGGAGGSGLAGGAAGYGSAGAGLLPHIADAGNLAWTDIAAANPELAGIQSLGSGLSASQILRGANSIRQLLGGQEGSPRGGMAMMMGAAPQIGQHRPNTDLYGLQASGLGPWTPFTKEDPKKKAIEALLAQQLPNWG